MIGLPKCDYPKCQGHLGKFDSCRDEALYMQALAYDAEYYGDSDDYTVMLLAVYGPVIDFSLGDNSPILISEGAYSIITASSGAVGVSYEASIQPAIDAFLRARDEYYAAEEED
jgi:hypothetical protein